MTTPNKTKRWGRHCLESQQTTCTSNWRLEYGYSIRLLHTGSAWGQRSLGGRKGAQRENLGSPGHVTQSQLYPHPLDIPSPWQLVEPPQQGLRISWQHPFTLPGTKILALQINLPEALFIQFYSVTTSPETDTCGSPTAMLLTTAPGCSPRLPA